jgi:uncharacterized protein DUF4288
VSHVGHSPAAGERGVMRTSSRPSWFGVKTIYRIEPLGRRLGTDRHFSKDMTMVEERVVVVRAHSADEAIRIGKVEARRYSRLMHRNPYGQRVRTRRLRCIDAYAMNEPLHEKAEVYSATQVVPRRVTDAAIIRHAFGPVESRRAYLSRRNILDISFNSPAHGVKRTKREAAYANKLTRRLK